MLTIDCVQTLFKFNLDWQIALWNYPGQPQYHLPADKLLHFFSTVSIVVNDPIQTSPLASAINVFIDADKRGYIGIYKSSHSGHESFRAFYATKSVQRAELK